MAAFFPQYLFSYDKISIDNNLKQRWPCEHLKTCFVNKADAWSLYLKYIKSTIVLSHIIYIYIYYVRDRWQRINNVHVTILYFFSLFPFISLSLFIFLSLPFCCFLCVILFLSTLAGVFSMSVCLELYSFVRKGFSCRDACALIHSP